MWNRMSLKLKARISLKNFYWMAFVVCLIAGSVSTVILNLIPKPDYYQMFSNPEEAIELISSNMLQFMGMYAFAAVMSVVVGIFITSPLSVGIRRFFMDATDGRTDISNILYGFRHSYINVVKVLFFRSLFVFLWTMLVFGVGYGIAVVFVVMNNVYIATAIILLTVIGSIAMGIVKSIQFFFVEFLLAENPGVNFRETLRKSKEMIAGEKFSVFVLKLSFLGWLLLGAIACGVGTVFVEPYILETEEMLYRVKTGRMNGHSYDMFENMSDF